MARVGSEAHLAHSHNARSYVITIHSFITIHIFIIIHISVTFNILIAFYIFNTLFVCIAILLPLRIDICTTL